jgi:hypothetical protein
MALHRFVTRPGIVLMTFLPLAAACSSSKTDEQPVDAGEAHFMKVMNLYKAYQADNKQRSPNNNEELKAWAKKQKKDKLAELGIEDVDKALISPRDNMPYVIRPVPPERSLPNTVIAHEQTGKDGKKMVLDAMGRVTIPADEEAFQFFVGGK